MTIHDWRTAIHTTVHKEAERATCHTTLQVEGEVEHGAFSQCYLPY